MGVLFGLTALVGWAWLVGVAGEAFKPSNLVILALIVIGTVRAGAALRNSWTAYKRPELIVLDRADDSVRRAGVKACALGDVERVVLRRFENSSATTRRRYSRSDLPWPASAAGAPPGGASTT